MKVREITIESHEKRAHPHAMGHRDVSITLTARLDKDDDPALMAEVLQAEADAHVDKYLDEWISQIAAAREAEKQRAEVETKCFAVGYSRDRKAMAIAVSEAASEIHHLKADPRVKGTLAALLGRQALAASKRIRNAEEACLKDALERAVAGSNPSDDNETELPF